MYAMRRIAGETHESELFRVLATFVDLIETRLPALLFRCMRRLEALWFSSLFCAHVLKGSSPSVDRFKSSAAKQQMVEIITLGATR